MDKVQKITAVLFDLDGTLVDTAPDLIYALHQTLSDYHYSLNNTRKLRAAAAHGCAVLIQAGFNEPPEHPQFEQWKKTFLSYYQQHLYQKSQLFEGIESVLSYLQENNLKWGIVTNKPRYLTDPLIAQISFKYPPQVVISGDTCKNAKPHPEPLLFACKKINQKPENTLYIGDAARDIEAGKNANMRTLGADYGYLNENEQAADWQPDAVIKNPIEIIDWLKNKM